MESKNYLGKKVFIKVDRQLGSKHPKWGFEYELNYGYIPGTISGDGEELDAYIIGVDNPVKDYQGVCIAYIKRLEEDDDKLIIVPEGIQVSDEEIISKTYFQEQYFKSIIIR